MTYRDIKINYNESEEAIHTIGLHSFIGKELKLVHINNLEGEINLLQYLIDYIIDCAPEIKEEQTVAYGLWLLKFTKYSEVYELYELNHNFEDWIRGAENSVHTFELQKYWCREENVVFSIPEFQQLIAISDGVMNGLPVTGMRYMAPKHMSGWYLVTELYNGDASTMKVIRPKEIVKGRKDLLQFFALPAGYSFAISDEQTCRIWKRLSD
jgi:hypothetical protein